jgi:tetratricopeptide (TPR) repeat protein
MENDDEIIRNLNSTNKDKEDFTKLSQTKKTSQLLSKKELPSNYKDGNNWLAYNYFLRFEFDKSTDLINKASTIKKDTYKSEFSIYTSALIKRHGGEIEVAIDLLKKCFAFNSNEIFTLKEIGKSLVLTGKYSLSIEIYDEVLASYPDDWETYHYKGIASMNNKSYEMAQACFDKALSLNYNEST